MPEMDKHNDEEENPCVKKPKLNAISEVVCSEIDVDPLRDDSKNVCKDIEITKEANSDNNNIGTLENPDHLSKRQRKKLLKLAQWEIKKKEKRLKEREKYKQKRIECITNGEPTRIGPSRKALKRNKMDNSTNPFTVAIDLDFDDLMIDKDICKCAKQLLWVYTINRKSATPLHLYYTGLKKDGRLQQALDRNDGYQNWDIKIKNESYLDIFEKEKIIYLTSDSDTVLTQLEPKSIYIIGGLVDHNHHKGLSYNRALEKGLKTARLPLSEHVSIKTRTVLTIVHVFDILLRISEGKSWPDALLGVLPMRKGAKRLTDNNAESIENNVVLST